MSNPTEILPPDHPAYTEELRQCAGFMKLKTQARPQLKWNGYV